MRNNHPNEDEAETQGRRRYVTRLVQQRLHQEEFRLRVLRACQKHCAICRLPHAELLDATHILPDGHPLGEPIVPTWLALCRLHHGAFDNYLLGVTPDHRIELRRDVLDEIDGPMLLHGLQGFHGQLIRLPARLGERPRREFLEERHALFRRAGDRL
jgi:putative restriction endonuclease